MSIYSYDGENKKKVGDQDWNRGYVSSTLRSMKGI